MVEKKLHRELATKVVIRAFPSQEQGRPNSFRKRRFIRLTRSKRPWRHNLSPVGFTKRSADIQAGFIRAGPLLTRPNASDPGSNAGSRVPATTIQTTMKKMMVAVAALFVSATVMAQTPAANSAAKPVPAKAATAPAAKEAAHEMKEAKQEAHEAKHEEKHEAKAAKHEMHPAVKTVAKPKPATEAKPAGTEKK